MEETNVMFWQKASYYNPAYSGLNKNFIVDLSSGISNNVYGLSTARLFIDKSIDFLHGGLSASFIYSRSSLVFHTNDVNLNYSFQAKIKAAELAFGIGVGAYRFYHNFESGWTSDDRNEKTEYKLNLGFAFRLRKFDIGVGFRRHGSEDIAIFNNYYSYSKSIPGRLFVSAGLKVDLNEVFAVKPQFLLRADAEEDPIGDINLQIFRKWLWIGCSYSSGGTMALMGGAEIIEKFNLSFAQRFEVQSTGHYNRFNEGELSEISLSYFIDKTN